MRHDLGNFLYKLFTDDHGFVQPWRGFMVWIQKGQLLSGKTIYLGCNEATN
ncbi:hypothetical protein AVEN_113887-1, partial [Araneus ventricosus]